MPATYPGANTSYVPDHEATGKMVVDFSRNESKFPLNRYVQIVPVKKTIGLYLNMTVEEAGRILNADGSDLIWPDGNDAPSGTDGTESHEFKEYRCERYAPSFRLGNMTVQQASWDIKARHAAIKAQQMMTLRTQLVQTPLLDTANYPTGHYSDVASISGNSGTWAQSTTARQDIKRSLNTAAEKILDATLAAVELDDLILVIPSAAASAISLSQEIVDHVKGSPEAWAQVRGELPNRNKFYGLPEKLYGFQVVVEDTRKVTSKKGATRAVSQVMTSTKAALISRPGGLVGVAEAPSFSSVTLFVWDQSEMLVETKEDQDNKRVLGRVVDVIKAVMTAPSASFLFTSTI